MSRFWIIIIFFTKTFFSFVPSVSSGRHDFPTANLSNSWMINRNTLNHSAWHVDSRVRLILLRLTFGPSYACGFYCDDNCDSYLFAILTVKVYSDGGFRTSPYIESPQVVWSANRNNPVRTNATLQLTAEGDLVLRDADGTLAWSTNTAGKAVAGLNLTEMGNLLLFDANNSVVWQSFDHPTDCLLPGQILLSGMNLTATASSTNWSIEGGLYSLLMTDIGLVASILSDPPQVYYKYLYGSTKQNKEASYAKFQNGSLDLYINGVEPRNPDTSIPIPDATSAQYMKLGADGHLRVFEWDYDWKEVADIFTSEIGEYGYPMVCGQYGICSNGQCTCPSGTSFRQKSERRPDLGCSEVIPLTCNASENHSFLDLDNVVYFAFAADIVETDMNRCKEACLKNCSCEAAIFRYFSNSSSGNCYLPSQIFSMMEYDRADYDYIYSVSVKVQIAPTASKGKNGLFGLKLLLGSTLGFFCVVVVIGTIVFVYGRRRRRSEEVEENYLDHVPGMPTRFSFEELATATDNFNKKLGGGGFGSVFEGLLNDGTRIAVKRLDGVGHIKKSFLAEVESIGNIHHVSLVRLIGFCAEKSHWLLVYEYMCNGSLDRWIYCRSHETSLDWNYRRKIILDIAKGLAYLHEDCRQKIIHLDIKPQNILLDEHYNAKLADFGLSKLIDRNQSKVVTTMRGTPGYLAPEWLHAVITEKVDVYSFGVVILEIVCGRKIFEQSRPEEERHLPTLFMKKADEGQWLDLVDKCCQDVESNAAEVEKMMRISAWCLQSDHEKRPSMSMVIKVLEGVKNVQRDIDYNFPIPEVSSQDVTPILPSVLSGPR